MLLIERLYGFHKSFKAAPRIVGSLKKCSQFNTLMSTEI